MAIVVGCGTAYTGHKPIIWPFAYLARITQTVIPSCESESSAQPVGLFASRERTMIRTVADQVWAFDLEWVPDPATGRRVYDLPPDMPDSEVIEVMWREGGATEENPHPYLKTMLCRVVSLAFVRRRLSADGTVSLSLHSLPGDPADRCDEAELIRSFFDALGAQKPAPQLVGYNSRSSDVPILIQRGIVHGVSAAGFCQKRNGNGSVTDYFHKYGDSHIDLKEVISGWGIATPKLHEFAAAARVPGKLGTKGDDVMALWVAGNIRRIVEYNQYDALTTYLLWLRTARFAGLFSDEAFSEEEGRVRELLERRIEDGDEHLARYRDKWAALIQG